MNHSNWTRKVFLLHKAVILRLMADFAIKKIGSSVIKIGKERIRDLTGDVRFPEVDHLG